MAQSINVSRYHITRRAGNQGVRSIIRHGVVNEKSATSAKPNLLKSKKMV